MDNYDSKSSKYYEQYMKYNHPSTEGKNYRNYGKIRDALRKLI